jgi:uncharacterized protein YjbI with pentapeptide repeats
VYPWRDTRLVPKARQAAPAPPDVPSVLAETPQLSIADDFSVSQVLLDGADLANQAARGGDFDQVVFRNVSFAGSRLVETKLTDVCFEQCDLAGAVWSQVAFLRIRFVGCRLSAFALNRATLVDVEITGCRGDSHSVFEADGRRWLIEDCDLPDFDARGLRLTGGRFDRCRLPRSQWGHAKLDQVAFVQSDLTAVGGTGGLSGTEVDTATLLTLAPALARHVGISMSEG